MICPAPSRLAAAPRPAGARRPAILLLAALAGLGLWTGAGQAARAGESEPVSLQGVEVRLLTAGGTGAERQAGIELRLAPHWKTYWRYPGDSGVPLSLSFTESQNVAAVEMAWPAPRRFSDGNDGFSIGYKSNVLFPLTVRLKDPAQPARLAITLDFAVCDALCLPAHVELGLDLDATPDPAAAQRIAAGRAKVPEPVELGALGAPALLSAQIDPASSPPSLVVEARVATPTADLFVEGPSDAWALPLPRKTALPGGVARFTLPLEGVPPGADLRTTPLTFTLADMTRSVTTTVVPGTGAEPTASAAPR